MRMIWLLGCVGMISTASAQPAPSPPPAPPADTALAPADTTSSPPADTTPAPAPSTAPAPPLAPPSAAPLRAAAPTPPAVAPLQSPAPASPGPGATSPAIAEPEPETETETETESYGWQIALADVASTAIIFTGGQNTTAAGLLTYALAGPVIHGAHEQGGRAVASLILRAGLPVVSAVTWAEIAKANTHCAPDDDDCGDVSYAAIFGFGLGIVSAMVLDDTLLAHSVKAKQPARLTWVPQVSATPQQVRLGVLGRF